MISKTLNQLNYSFLLFLLILYMLLQPILPDFILGRFFSNLLFTGIIFTAVFLGDQNKRLFKILISASALAILTRWTSYLLDLGKGLVYFSAIIDSIVLLITCLVITKQIIRIKTVNYHILSGTITLYFLIGFTFAFMHIFIYLIDPGAYQMNESLEFQLAGENVSSIFIYYSMVTLTTLGFGDISPVSYLARNITILEAVIGQMFIAILVGRLIGLSISKHARETIKQASSDEKS